jgi:hypothetical protein
MFDARAELVAQKIFGEAWREHVGHYEDDSFLTAFLEELRVIGNATGNALIDTGWGLVTLGFGEPWNAFDTSGEGYARAYLITRVTFEVGLGFGLGAAASAPGKLGKIAFAVDMAGNATAVARGGYGVARDGELNFSNGADLVGGALGIGGGVLGKAFKSADEFAEGTESVDEIVEGTADASKIDGGCFLPGQMVADLETKPEPLLAAGVTGQSNDAEQDHMEAWILSILAAGVAIAALRLEKRRLRHSLGAGQSRQIVLLDELFSSESFCEPQPEDHCRELAVT